MEYEMKNGRFEVRCVEEEHGEVRPFCQTRISTMKRFVQVTPKSKPRIERYVEFQFSCPLCKRTEIGEVQGGAIVLKGA